MADHSIEMSEKEIRQFIAVQIGGERYGIDISNVDNIVRMQKITRVPKAQSYFSGIINLRGEIVPVMSIRRKMGLEDDVITKDSRIIILKIDDIGMLGIIVDAVAEVVNLSADQIEIPTQGTKQKDNFINGIGKNGDQLISLLELHSIIDEKEGSQ